MMDLFFQGDLTPQPMNYQMVALSLLLSFLSGHVIAWIYAWTHNGLSYSRSFVRSIVLMPVIVALVLMVLSNSIVTAFGLMAVLAIVRFRNVLRDTLDTTYLLASIVLGMACGTQRYTTAVIGCALLAAIFAYLKITSFGTRQNYDYILNLNWKRPLNELSELSSLLNRHTTRALRASQSESRTGGTDLSYRVLLRDPERAEEMINELRELPGVERIHSIAAENESEI
jgi:uncharacterized membrane protein YhiD involved in acid resistance